MSNRHTIILDSLTPLAAGGYVLSWREERGGSQHSTFTNDPQGWLWGYLAGSDLQALQPLPLNGAAVTLASLRQTLATVVPNLTLTQRGYLEPL